MLSGGELPALALLDAVARLQPGVLGDERSHQQDSFSRRACSTARTTAGPERLGADGAAVPAVLLSGHHARDRRAGGASSRSR